MTIFVEFDFEITKGHTGAPLAAYDSSVLHTQRGSRGALPDADE